MLKLESRSIFIFRQTWGALELKFGIRSIDWKQLSPAMDPNTVLGCCRFFLTVSSGLEMKLCDVKDIRMLTYDTGHHSATWALLKLKPQPKTIHIMNGTWPENTWPMGSQSECWDNKETLVSPSIPWQNVCRPQCFLGTFINRPIFPSKSELNQN